MEVHNPTVSDLKCPTCFITFEQIETHKEHYKSDFHRYNLKRKMVKLSPVSLDQFKAKRAEAEPENNDEFKCNECGKKFSSANTFNQHVETKKHNPNLIRSEEKKEKKAKIQPFKKNLNVCIFCKIESPNFSENLRHMQSSHSFFIPEQTYCNNKEGLVEYLQEKVEVGFMCITCENKNAHDFCSGESVRKHMNDRGHNFMKTDEGYDEYLEYYDFSSQFKEILESQKDKYVAGIEYTTLKIVEKDERKKEDTKVVDGEEDGEWESEDESDDEDDDGDEEIREKEEEKPKRKVKIYHVMRPTVTSNGELLLPNGKTLGHRKFRYLYNQTYRNTFWLNQDIKSLGYEFNNNAIISRERMMQVNRQDKLLYRFKNRWNKKELTVGMQNNLQKYFRTRNSL